MAFVRTDRFGNPSLLKLAKPVTNKKTGDVMPIYRAFAQIGNVLYRIDISDSLKAERPGKWVKITKLVSRGFGGGQRGGFGGGGSQGQSL
jgi:hypothetical protein